MAGGKSLKSWSVELPSQPPERPNQQRMRCCAGPTLRHSIIVWTPTDSTCHGPNAHGPTCICYLLLAASLRLGTAKTAPHQLDGLDLLVLRNAPNNWTPARFARLLHQHAGSLCAVTACSAAPRGRCMMHVLPSMGLGEERLVSA